MRRSTKTYQSEPKPSDWLNLKPEHVLTTLSYSLEPGAKTWQTLSDWLKTVKIPSAINNGVWLIREDRMAAHDEHGWVCIHWPTFLSKLVWREQSACYLRSQGVSLRGLQNMPYEAFEDAQTVINTYKAALLRQLPPGCLVEAHTDFFHDIVEPFVRPEHYELFDENHLSASMGPWSFFRLGALGRKNDKLFYTTLNRYRGSRDELICQAASSDLSAHPVMIRCLIHAMQRARYSDGQGYTKWGLAWVKGGLVFNYRLALHTLQYEHFPLWQSLFHGREDPAGEWLDSSYLLQTAGGDFPPLGAICRTGPGIIGHIHDYLRPYTMLFEDIEPAISARAHMHNLEFQAFFPITFDDKMNVLKYIEQIAVPPSLMKNIRALYSNPILVREKPAAPIPAVAEKLTKEHELLIYPVGFNGYNLGCTLPAPTDLPLYPFNINYCEYKGQPYFSLPDNIVAMTPELIMDELYDVKKSHIALQWLPHDTEGFAPRILEPKNFARLSGAGPYAELTLPRADTKRLPLVRHIAPDRKSKAVMTFFHPAVFRKDGEMDRIIKGIIENRPAITPAHINLLSTVQTLWQWVYDLPSVIAQGKVSEEFMYNVGRDTTHCPENRLLNSPSKRMQYIIDKAMHSKDMRVCDIAPSSDRSAPRSKQMNSYDDFAMWYAAHHEIAELPWKLDTLQQAEYICKRWLPWRRASGLVNHLVTPHKQGKQRFISAQMPQLLAYARKTFGPSYTEY